MKAETTTTTRAVLFAVGLVAAALGTAVPAGAQPPVDCEVRDAGGQCTGSNSGEGGPEDGGTASRGPLTCKWLGFEDQAYGHTLFPPPENTLVDGGLIVYEDCGRPQGNGQYDPWEKVGATGSLAGFIGPAFIQRAVAWADPAEIAQNLWAEISIGLPPPEPVISPPLSAAAIIDQPTFVAVANWPGVIGPREACDGPVCIELTATPTLVFDPGDGSAPITCSGSGTWFDPAGPEPAVQAEGACAHVYDRRTIGEPFPGSVAIEWEVLWTSETPDDSGVIDVTPQGVSVPRLVDEVQSVVVDARDGEA